MVKVDVTGRRTSRRLERGRPKAASKALGYLAHIVGDIAQPMHTDQRDREDDIHSSYESAVDARIGNYPFRHDGRDGRPPLSAHGEARPCLSRLLLQARPLLRPQRLHQARPPHHQATVEARSQCDV